MQIQKKEISAIGIKFFITENNKEIARAYLYTLPNDLHKRPFGFIEDVYVDESTRGKGLGSKLLEHIITEAKRLNCYKLICTTRYEKERVHSFYKKFGFKDHGKEFRIDF